MTTRHYTPAYVQGVIAERDRLRYELALWKKAAADHYHDVARERTRRNTLIDTLAEELDRVVKPRPGEPEWMSEARPIIAMEIRCGLIVNG